MADNSQPTADPAQTDPRTIRELINARTREMLQDVFVDDYAQKNYIAREAMTRGYGLSGEAFNRPFPGSSSSTQIQTSGGNGNGASSLAKSVAGPLLGLAIGLGGVSSLAMLLDRDPPQPPPAVAPVAQPVDGGARVRVYWGDQEIMPDSSLSGRISAGQ